ncbi:hypothetical protein EXIGLDRAFT_428778 [Exidia glandulosa HHB12029]|uniref:Uncharacterized protein n=1 Tax=Exidia glandulosa HHB12029 TaxID=1314781 RepID=A0A165KJE3_EXIGL|nr:hypothetical protein EXIGLDRAFT_428778 [Exidia glandulosa HHB12029]
MTLVRLTGTASSPGCWPTFLLRRMLALYATSAPSYTPPAQIRFAHSLRRDDIGAWWTNINLPFQTAAIFLLAMVMHPAAQRSAQSELDALGPFKTARNCPTSTRC